MTIVGNFHCRSSEENTGFAYQRLAMHVMYVKDGVGALTSLLRDRRVRSDRLRTVLAGAGVVEPEYSIYDRAVSSEARFWLRQTGQRLRKSWVLLVGFVSPHFPWTAPQRFYDL